MRHQTDLFVLGGLHGESRTKAPATIIRLWVGAREAPRTIDPRLGRYLAHSAVASNLRLRSTRHQLWPGKRYCPSFPASLITSSSTRRTKASAGSDNCFPFCSQPTSALPNIRF